MNESEEIEEKKNIPFSTLTCCKDSRPCLIVSPSQLDAPVIHGTFASLSYQHGHSFPSEEGHSRRAVCQFLVKECAQFWLTP